MAYRVSVDVLEVLVVVSHAFVEVGSVLPDAVDSLCPDTQQHTGQHE